MSRNERARTTVSFFFLIQITLMRLVPLTPTVFTLASGKGAERLVHLWKILSPKYAGLVGRVTVRIREPEPGPDSNTHKAPLLISAYS